MMIFEAKQTQQSFQNLQKQIKTHKTNKSEANSRKYDFLKT